MQSRKSLTSPYLFATILKNVTLYKMSEIFRFGVSVERVLLNKFDQLIKKRGYSNRSEALRDLIREELIREEWKENREIAGAITLIYDHHKRELVDKLMNIQHNYRNIIISTQHIHLDHNNCLEIIAVKGKSKEIQKLANTLRSIKGVKHGSLSMSTTGKDIE
jgi:CopG family nickel-responsive transcriptional regulator